MVKRWRHCRRQCCRCWKAIATAAASRPYGAPPSANGNCRWTPPSPARACSLSTSTTAPAVDGPHSFVLFSQPTMSTWARYRPSHLFSWRSLPSAVLLVIVASVALTAAMPTFWTVSTQTDFLKGDVTDLSIDSDGRVFLGPSSSLVAETAAPFLWTMAAGADGTLWAGTGNEGKVLKVGKDGKIATFFDATELEVHAIALGPNGGLYAATSPDGKIYQVAADG